jgi:hypothetical protein
MSTLSASEQKLFDFALAALPHWYKETERDYEIEAAYAKCAQDAKDKVDDWLVTQALIATATGATSTEPDYLGQHGTDRGMFRANGESDTTLRNRLKDVPEMLTIPSIKEAIQTILTAEAVSGTPEIVELRAQRGYMGNEKTYAGSGGLEYAVGGTFASTVSATTTRWRFTPTDAWDTEYTPIKTVQEIRRATLQVLASCTAGNQGAFEILSLEGNDLIFSNPSGVAEVSATVHWNVDPQDMDGNFRATYNLANGRKSTYLSRGYRMGAQQAAIVIILPYGSTAATAASTEALANDKRAAGVRVYVERRTSP